MVGREREIVRHLSEEELDRLQSETDSIKEYKRLTFLKRLYDGAALAAAAQDIGVSQGTASNWVTRWNEGGLGKLTPNFGGGRPPKLDEAEQEQLIARLREGQPWKKQEIQHLLNEEFDVEYHPHYLPTFLDKLGLHYAIPRTKRPKRPENAEEILDERVRYAFDEEALEQPHNKREDDADDEDWDRDENIRTDGGTVVGFFDISHPQPWDNFQRMYTVDEPHIERKLVKIDTPAAGFYALNGESVLSFPPNQEKEKICGCFEKVREQNPAKRILLVLDNFSSHVCKYTRKRAHELGIDLIFLPVGSPDLNPIEPVWKSLKWESSPFIVEGGDEYRRRITELFGNLTNQLSFASSWIENHLDNYLNKLV
ncbi:transposase [Haloarcula quadrata]|uniref:Transposase n=2 Tax=Haloarcula TaxID=2237 RepID=A0A495QQS3_9EURY|nr:IS630 family transposase [Haloarcula quadrata]RKS75847.1 transposase [Haloarcula quadrata]